ncbi:MAG: thermonuclease family protein [Gammaproteobacteria bacterium]|nr:thermonuclease family protein [Gammaproteobacteria bacterium]
MIEGTHLNVAVVDVVDGDTLKVKLPDGEIASLRLLCLDTEESFSLSSKPVTPWGVAAKKFAESYFAAAPQITIEFPGHEDVATCLSKYRDNFSRLLVFAHANGEDFQQRMIAEGYSPYFCKYGFAEFADKHLNYSRAEVIAQQNDRGVWNQMEVNGSVARDYPKLCMWWNTRATRIDEFRRLRQSHSYLLNTRWDYQTLYNRAKLGQQACIFTELGYIKRAGGVHGLIDFASEAQPFNIFVPRLFSDEMKPLLNLLNHRYLGSDESPAFSYAYLQGELSLYQGKPQLWLRQISQISDLPPPAPKYSVYISALLPDPLNADAGAETLTLHNAGSNKISLQGWFVEDKMKGRFNFEGELSAGEIKQFTLPAYGLQLNNTGDELYLYDDQQQLQQRLSYEKQQVRPGETLHFTAPA